MSFSWRKFCERNNIPFDEKGAHTARDNIYIRCPMCGDEKKRMGLSLKTEAWGCWKNPQHRGKSPINLVRAILKCTWGQAAEEIKSNEGPSASLGALAAMLEQPEQPSRELALVEYPDGMPRLRKSAHPKLVYAWNYMRERGFTRLEKMCEYYDVRVGTDGDWKGRVVFPFHFRGGLRGWTARAISRRERIKYKSYPSADVPRALLFNFDKAMEGGRTLVVVEGPTDCYKIDWFGMEIGVRAVGLLGLHFNSERVNLLAELMEHFDELVFLLDATALPQAFNFTSQIPHLEPIVRQLPAGVEDPGDFNRQLVHLFFQRSP